MTDTQQTQSAPPRRSLRRSRRDNMFAGVAAGLGEHLAINAWWFRWAFIILTFFGGLGILLYVLAWIFIPAEDEEDTAVVRWLESLDLTDTGTVLGVVLIGVAAVVVATWVVDVPGALVLAAILAAVGILLYRGDLAGPEGPDNSSQQSEVRSQTGEPDTGKEPEGGEQKSEDPAEKSEATGEKSEVRSQKSEPETAPGSEAGGTVASMLVADAVSAADRDGGDVGPRDTGKVKDPGPPKPPKPRREPSMLGRLTIAVLLIVLSGMALIDASGFSIGGIGPGEFFDPVHYAATGLAVLAVGLIVGAFVGRARWLIVIALLSLPFVFVASVWPRSFEWTADDGYIAPQQIEQVQNEYSLGAGRLELNLLAFTPDELAELGRVAVTVGAGELLVLIPSDAGAMVDASVGLGSIDFTHQTYEQTESGVDAGFQPSFVAIDSSRNGFNAKLRSEVGPPPHDWTLDLEVGAGKIELRVMEGSRQ